MRVLKNLFLFLVTGIFMISLTINAASADEQICLKLLPPYGLYGPGPIVLTLGSMSYGNNHFALVGTATEYHIDTVTAIGLVHGNAEIVNGMIEVALIESIMTSDNQAELNYSYHVRLDMKTLSGTHTTSTNNKTIYTGTASVISCTGM